MVKTLLCLTPLVCAAADSYLLLTAADAAALKHSAAQHASAANLRKAADQALEAGPWSVTFSRPRGTPAGPHDFFSEGPYWWPDPKNPKGPYIRRDGEVNPNRFTDNDRHQNEMCEAALALGTAAWLFDDARYNARLQKVLSTWFLDEKTRMAPHLNFAQAIRGRTTGRAAGLIETRPYIWLIQGVMLAEHAPGWNPETGRALRQWFTEFLRWFTTDEKGKQEMKSGNNHSTWWAAQVAAFALFTGDTGKQRMVWDLYRGFLLPGQFRPDGSAPREEARTRSLSYSAMNLDAFALLCRMAQVAGVDLWHYKTPKGVTMTKAFDYLAPYVTGEKVWQKPQITKFDGSRTIFLALAGHGLNRDDYLAAQRRVGLSGGAAADFIALLTGLR